MKSPSSFDFSFIKKLFPEIVGNYLAKLGIALNLVDPKCGGCVIVGAKGTGKSLLLKSLKTYLSSTQEKFVEIPSHVREENLLSGLDIEKTLEKGEPQYIEGLLERARGGYVLLDDLHLLRDEVLSLIFENLHNYCLITTINSDDGEVSPHYLDKIGLCAPMEQLTDRRELLRVSLTPLSVDSSTGELKKRIGLARGLIKSYKVEHHLWDYLTERALSEGIRTHRAEIFLFFAGRALAGLLMQEYLQEQIFDLVTPLVFSHRKIQVNERTEEHKNLKTKEENDKERDREDRDQKPNQAEKQNESKGGEQKFKGEERQERSGETDLRNNEKPIEEIIHSPSKEEIFRIGPFSEIRKLLLPKSRKLTKSSGRRSRAKTYRRGYKLRSLPYAKDREIDIYETLKKASMYQKIRGSVDRIVIKREDLCSKERGGKESQLLLFVVDASGSQGVKRRMEAVKGAIFSLLIDAYKKRDKVALIIFRKFGAELLLPPTQSVQLAHRALKNIITGGNTPLSAGLFEAYRLIKKYHHRNPGSKVILIILTDGKTNIPIKKAEDPLKEVSSICSTLRELPYIYPLVIDTEIKTDLLRMDLAKDIAKWLGAKYYELEALSNEGLINLIRTHQQSL